MPHVSGNAQSPPVFQPRSKHDGDVKNADNLSVQEVPKEVPQEVGGQPLRSPGLPQRRLKLDVPVEPAKIAQNVNATDGDASAVRPTISRKRKLPSPNTVEVPDHQGRPLLKGLLDEIGKHKELNNEDADALKSIVFEKQIELGDFEGAMETISSSTNKFTQVNSLLALGVAQSKSQPRQDAKSTFTQVLDLARNNFGTIDKESDFFSVGEDFREVQPKLHIAIRSNIFFRTADALLHAGFSQEAKKALEEGLNYFNQEQKDNPKGYVQQFYGHKLLGLLYHNLGDTLLSKSHFKFAEKNLADMNKDGGGSLWEQINGQPFEKGDLEGDLAIYIARSPGGLGRLLITDLHKCGLMDDAEEICNFTIDKMRENLDEVPNLFLECIMELACMADKFFSLGKHTEWKNTISLAASLLNRRVGCSIDDVYENYRSTVCLAEAYSRSGNCSSMTKKLYDNAIKIVDNLVSTNYKVTGYNHEDQREAYKRIALSQARAGYMFDASLTAGKIRDADLRVDTLVDIDLISSESATGTEEKNMYFDYALSDLSQVTSPVVKRRKLFEVAEKMAEAGHHNRAEHVLKQAQETSVNLEEISSTLRIKALSSKVVPR